MKRNTTSSQPELPAAGVGRQLAGAPPAPVLDRKSAKSVPAYRHEGTARTVALHQTADAGQVHLFGATGVFVATIKAAEAAKNEPKPEAPKAEAPAPEAPSAS